MSSDAAVRAMTLLQPNNPEVLGIHRLPSCFYCAGFCVTRFHFGKYVAAAEVSGPEEISSGQGVIGRRGEIHHDWDILMDTPDLVSHPECRVGELKLHGADELVRDVYRRELVGSDIGLIECYVGHLAELRSTEPHWDKSDLRPRLNRLRTANKHARERFPDGEQKTAKMRCQELAISLVRSDKVWAAIEAVARELWRKRKLTGSEVSSICEEVYGRGRSAYKDWLQVWPPAPQSLLAG